MAAFAVTNKQRYDARRSDFGTHDNDVDDVDDVGDVGGVLNSERCGTWHAMKSRTHSILCGVWTNFCSLDGWLKRWTMLSVSWNIGQLVRQSERVFFFYLFIRYKDFGVS